MCIHGHMTVICTYMAYNSNMYIHGHITVICTWQINPSPDVLDINK